MRENKSRFPFERLCRCREKRKQHSKCYYSIGAIFLIAAIGIALWLALSGTSDSKEEVVRIRVESTDSILENTSETTEFDTVAGAVSTASTTVTTTTRPVTTKKSTTSKTITKVTTTALEIAFPLELNRATVEELAQIPGIGDVLAARIVAYRDEIGGFINRTQLLDVSGIGETKFAVLCEYVYLTEKMAQDILEFRAEIQYFSDPYELMYVVSRTCFVKIEPYVTVDKTETSLP